jgi:signal transduction histidine kinase
VLQVTVTSISAENNGQLVAVALVRDITENERLEKTRHDYVANISHELRTPLSSMRGLIEGLRDGVVTRDSDRQRYYSILGSEVLRLSRLVNDLLELSGLQSSTDAFEMETVDVTEMMYDLHDRYKKMFEEQKKQFILKLPEEQLPKVYSNEDRITQVLTIFLDNAIKYTQTGGRVEIGVSRKPEGVYFYVSDNGIGIEENTVDKIFDRFYRVDKARSRALGGTGLGLAIAKEITEAHGGTISIVSEQNKGTDVTIRLPVIQN